MECKFKGILRTALLGGRKHKLHEIIAHLDNLKIGIAGEAVLGHRVDHAVNDHLFILGHAAHREQHRCRICPHRRVCLPHDFTAIVPLEGNHLSALGPDLCGGCAANKLDIRHRIASWNDLLVYSTHGARIPA